MKELIGTTVCKIEGKEVQIAFGWDEKKIVYYGEGETILGKWVSTDKEAVNEEHARIIVKEYFNQDSI